VGSPLRVEPEAAPAAGGYTCSAVATDKSSIVSTHLMEDLQIWETVEPNTMQRQPDGQRGLSVVTNLCSEASPQLRFLVGDFCTLSHERCELRPQIEVLEYGTLPKTEFKAKRVKDLRFA
jgi:phenylacetate-coenzyme A ligase PaaK-like adenylate-forming protein